MKSHGFRKYSVELCTPLGSATVSWLTRLFRPWTKSGDDWVSVGVGPLSLALEWHQLWWDNCADIESPKF